MSDRASNLVAGISGVLYVVGVVVGFGFLVGTLPELGASADEVRDFLDRSEARVWAGGYIGLIGFLFFLVFAGRLWGLLRMAEGEPGWISTTGLAAATAVVAILAAGDVVPAAAGFHRGQRNLDPEVVGALFDARHFSEILTPLVFAVFLGCVALLVIRTGVLPRWLGWAAGVLAGLSLVAVPFGYEASQIPVFLSALWILAISIVFIARRQTLGRRMPDEALGA